MPRKKAAAKSEAEETTEVLDTKEPERPMSPNEGPAEIGQAGDEASCAGVLEPAGEEEPDAEAAVSQQDMSVADMLLPEENADSNAVPMESDMPEEEPPTEEILAGTLLESGEDTFRTQKMEAESADDEPMQDWGDAESADGLEHFEPEESEEFLGNESGGEMPKEPAMDTRTARAKAREEFFGLDIKTLDRDLSPLQKKEWTDIYSSFRAGTPIAGTVSGKEEIELTALNKETGRPERISVLCFTVINYRVKVLIPETALWNNGKVLKRHVASHMVGANIQYVITSIDREGECALASRSLAMEQRRRAFARARSGNTPGDIVPCNVLVVGPKQVLLECGGYDLVLRPADLSYSSILDLRDEYRSGQVLEAVIKEFDPEVEKLEVSVKEVNPNPFDGADTRHPVGSDRQAIVTNRYRGGVFCRLADTTTCMCLFGRGYTEYDCNPGDRVIVHITRYDYTKKHIYGRTGMGNFPGVSGNSRAGENELSKLATMVNLKPDCVPKLWGKLPFVDKPRCRSF